MRWAAGTGKPHMKRCCPVPEAAVDLGEGTPGAHEEAVVTEGARRSEREGVGAVGDTHAARAAVEHHLPRVRRVLRQDGTVLPHGDHHG